MWENSILALWDHGVDVRTEYDRKDNDGNFIDPPSTDCTMMMSCPTPDAEPSIHRCTPGGLEDLETYRLEVVEGIHDHWMDRPDPHGTMWSYTYHDRLTKYRYCDHRGCAMLYDQLMNMAQKLAKSPHSRRHQAITWMVWEDTNISDPPCLQSIWCRILPDEDGVWYLNMNVRFRSRDAYEAAFMNVWAFAGSWGLQGHLAASVAALAGREVRCGHYCDQSDSYHIYGHRLEKFKAEFLGNLHKRPDIEDRTYTRAFAQEFFDAAAKKAREEVGQD
jgi:thymidylate synthase